MQEQNFEKQVQQKMEEFSLTPSAPVWQKVEQEIQQKKRRRRVAIFWLLPFLLVGTGLLLWQIGPSSSLAEKTSSIKPKPTDLPKTSTAKETTTKETTISNSIENPIIAPNTIATATSSTKNSIPKSNRYNEQPIINATVKSKTVKQGSVASSQTITLAAATKEANETITDPVAKKSTQLPVRTEEKNTSTTRSTPIPNFDNTTANVVVTNNSLLTDTLNRTLSSTLQKSELTASTPKPHTPEIKATIPIKDSIAVQKGKKKETKWSFTMQASIGISSIQSNLLAAVSNTPQVRSDFSMNSAPLTPAAAFQQPSAVEKSINYQLSFLAKRSITNRINGSIGLQYSQFSTRNKIGQSVTRDTVITIAGANKSIDGYFQTGPNSQLQNYTNKYHFLELPLAIEWQLLKRIPLRLQAGTNVSYLIASNALVYDARARIYYHNKDIFNKLQVHINSGITYQVWKKKQWSLQAGPYLQYGVTNLQKDKVSNNYHLFATGIKTQISF